MNGDAKRNKANCLEDLRRRILTEALEPGSYLDETEISSFYGISRPPLRELLRLLAGEGYLILHENRGAQVAPITLQTLRNLLIAAPMIHAGWRPRTRRRRRLRRSRTRSAICARPLPRTTMRGSRWPTSASIRSSRTWPPTNICCPPCGAC